MIEKLKKFFSNLFEELKDPIEELKDPKPCLGCSRDLNGSSDYWDSFCSIECAFLSGGNK